MKKIIFHSCFGVFVYDLKEQKMAYAINTSDGSYIYEKYEPVENRAEYDDAQKYAGDQVENLTYTSDGQTWQLFENWTFE